MGDIPHEWRKWLVEEKGYSTYKLPSDPYELYHPIEGRRIAFPAEHSDTAFMTEQALAYMQEVLRFVSCSWCEAVWGCCYALCEPT